jgi:hypothetical protein
MTEPKTPKLVLPKAKLPRLYRVTVSYDVLVLSHSSTKAEAYASDLDLHGEEVSDVFTHKAKRDNIDQDWMDSLPYIARDVKDPEHQKDHTVEEWLGRIEEEDSQRKAQAEADAKQEKLPGIT